MKKMILSVLSGTLLLLPPVSFAGTIEPYQAKQIEVYKQKENKPSAAKTIKPHQANQIKAYRGREVKPVQGAGQARLFTKEEREQMLRNDRAAGRTRDSMSTGNGAKPANGQNSIMFKDPYNTGGWNHNTNQPASPIWNPNSQ